MSYDEQDDTDINLHQLATELMLAMLSSADPEKIGALHWWSRARTALYSGASRAYLYSEMISIMGSKLQIDVLNERSAVKISKIGNMIGDRFERFRHICERDSLFIVAEAQTVRSLQKERI